MKFLIIGGSRFSGRYLCEELLQLGHEVTAFNRGTTSDTPVPGVEEIQGDRHFDLNKLQSRKWDTVIDMCGFLPASVQMTADALKDSVDNYVFVSSISAYAGFEEPDQDESAPVAQLTPEMRERAANIDITNITALALGDMYGPLKAECEQVVQKAFPANALIVRPGLIVGGLDYTDRFTYWVMRVADGGEVLCPGSRDRHIQVIDARDLAGWIARAAVNHLDGEYNVTGPPFELTMGGFLEEIKRVTSSDAKFVWVSEDFLRAESIEPWSDMPLYLYESDPGSNGFLSVNVDKAIAAGLRTRPIGETILDTYNWRKDIDRPLSSGIDRERESNALKKWREQMRGKNVAL